ncbi:MAG: cell division protein CrgA [Actinomycetota bacterium]|nr:cell division protein CrgA [Actinomycetota bacterium]
MPISRIRRKSAYTAPKERTPVRVGSPRWLAPLMVALFLVGLAWIVVYYVTQARYPIAGIGNWNMAVGFGFILAGFVLSTQWR